MLSKSSSIFQRSSKRCSRRREVLLAKEGEDNNTQALIAVLRPEENTIVLEGRTSWTVTRRLNGSFEFVCTSEHGYSTVARWVLGGSSMASPRSSSHHHRHHGHEKERQNEEYMYSFSLIDPSSRRHPVLATLGPTSLHVKDTYQLPLSSVGSRDDWDGRAVYMVDESTRTLIWATAVWVSLCLGHVDT